METIEQLNASWRQEVTRGHGFSALLERLMAEGATFTWEDPFHEQTNPYVEHMGDEPIQGVPNREFFEFVARDAGGNVIAKATLHKVPDPMSVASTVLLRAGQALDAS